MRSKADEMLEQIERSKDCLVNLTCDLIRIRTVNPPGENYQECADYLARKLGKIGMDVRLIEVPEKRLKELGLEPPRIIVIGDLKGNKGQPTLHINGHYDVVPPGSDWIVDPFAGLVKEDKIYGRGATDMKGSLASMIMAADAVIKSGIELEGNLSISFTPDEETGGLAGAGYLVESGLAKGDMAIVAEGGYRGLEVPIAHKGALWMEITTIGKAVHSSRPQWGINAIEKMVKIIMALEKFNEDLRKKTTKSSSLFHDVPWSTITATVIRGGTKINVIPDRCTISIDSRLLPEEDYDKEEEAIKALLEKLEKDDSTLQVETKTLQKIHGSYTTPTEGVVQSLVNAIREVTGSDPLIRGIDGFSDMHFFSKLMPTAMYGISVKGVSHSASEYVFINDLVLSSKVLALTILDLIG